MGSSMDCRICSEWIDDCRSFNIFEDEYFFDTNDGTKIKIYMCLNNFLYEKLYEKDDFSCLICNECCTNLRESYSFMLRVRGTEQNLKLGIKSHTHYELSLPQDKTTAQEESECIESNLHETTVYKRVHETEIIEQEELESSDSENASVIQRKSVKQQKSKKQKSFELPDTISVTSYEIEQSQDSDQRSVITLKIGQLEVDRPDDISSLTFLTDLFNSEDPNSLYKCKFCVKAFSNCQFLLNHTITCHLCTFCLHVSENNKALNAHFRSHSFDCLFCERKCESVGNYRQHLRRIHSLALPSHIGILTERSKSGELFRAT